MSKKKEKPDCLKNGIPRNTRRIRMEKITLKAQMVPE